jgi:hypothetical protein
VKVLLRVRYAVRSGAEGVLQLQVTEYIDVGVASEGISGIGGCRLMCG